jgi:hypothetical protein
MLEFLWMLGWLVRFFASYPFSWAAQFFSFLAHVIGGYQTIVAGAVVKQKGFGYAIFHRSRFNRQGLGKWTEDVHHAETALLYEITRAVRAHVEAEAERE